MHRLIQELDKFEVTDFGRIWRRFSPHAEAFARHALLNPVSQSDWSVIPSTLAPLGKMEPKWVSDGSNFCVAKPYARRTSAYRRYSDEEHSENLKNDARTQQHMQTAPWIASELIASRLAFFLELPVPPSVLNLREDEETQKYRHLSRQHLSLYPFQEPVWQNSNFETYFMNDTIDSAVVNEESYFTFLRTISAMIPFYAWLSCADIAARNVVITAGKHETKYAFTDFGDSGIAVWSLDHADAAKPNDVFDGHIGQFFSTTIYEVDFFRQEDYVESLNRIRNLSPDLISSIVESVPPECFENEEIRGQAKEVLLYRQANLSWLVKLPEFKTDRELREEAKSRTKMFTMEPDFAVFNPLSRHI